MFATTRSGPFIKQFDGPGDNGIVCFKFWQAVVASGCPGECAYCLLQTQYPYRRGLYELKGTLFKNLHEIVQETKRWLRQAKPAGLIVGENQDGLAFEKPYKQLLDATPLELLIPLFQDENPVGHTLIVLSKFVSTEYAEALGPSNNVVFSWSLSLPSISRMYEQKVSPLELRLKKAEQLKRLGYRIRFRLDALAPIPNWQQELIEVMDQINSVGPEMLTVGALRASNRAALKRAAETNGRDGGIFDHLVTIDPSGFKHRTNDEFHTAIFRMIRERLSPGISLGLCKEDKTMWKATPLRWEGCHCLHGRNDLVALERMQPAARQLRVS